MNLIAHFFELYNHHIIIDNQIETPYYFYIYLNGTSV